MRRSNKYDARTERLLALLPIDVTDREFAILAVACADQAGLSQSAQSRLIVDLAIDISVAVVARKPEIIVGVSRLAFGELMVLLAAMRTQLASEKNETVRVTYGLGIDEIVAELERRNSAVAADRAAKGAAS